MKRFIGWAVLIVISAVAFCPPLMAAEKVKLRLQCVYPESAQMGQATKFFVQRVAELTGGNLEITIFWPDQLVKTA
ncbi:MAG: hypothetical protein MUC57_15645, partial [Desulfobacterales bacterium]|nr:hypothetical protein [Desulfobacterales bacterium]